MHINSQKLIVRLVLVCYKIKMEKPPANSNTLPSSTLEPHTMQRLKNEDSEHQQNTRLHQQDELYIVLQNSSQTLATVEGEIDGSQINS